MNISFENIFFLLGSVSSVEKSGRFVVIKPFDVPDINENGMYIYSN
jgi:hypothetical protein